MRQGCRVLGFLWLILLPRPVPAGEAPARIEMPRHYQHIRIAALAYHGNPLGATETALLRSSVDLVVANPSFLARLHEVTPRTPRLIYSNTSNLYQELLLDWLAFADARRAAREQAFYHAAHPRPYQGHSPSSVPVTWFWRAWRGRADLTEITTAARGETSFALGGSNESVYFGHPDRFRELHLVVNTPAGAGWHYTLEYCAQVNDNGTPNAWQPLTLTADTTQGLSRSGTLCFDPPRTWRPALVNRGGRLYYLRLRTTGTGTPPQVNSVLGRDYVGARNTRTGVIPVFDARADADGDGYLNDAEYARRTPGQDARFLHESRLVTENYGTMRFVSNPSSPAFRTWAVDYHRRLLQQHPRADGLFMDNSGGKTHLQPGWAVEAIANFGEEQGQILAALYKELAPRLVLANTAGGGAAAATVIRHNPAYFEEFALKPLAQTHEQFEKLRDLLAQRSRLTTPPPLAVLDSHPHNGGPDDPRTQLATLAAYYLVADPEYTMLAFYGGFEPGTTWQRHWVPAAARDVGPPRGPCAEQSRGVDPANARLEYRIYQRVYQNALVLYRPLSLGRDRSHTASLGDDSAVLVPLGEPYVPVRADNTTGPPVVSMRLRNGEGTILLRLGNQR